MTEKMSLKDGGKPFKTPKYCANNTPIHSLCLIKFAYRLANQDKNNYQKPHLRSDCFYQPVNQKELYMGSRKA